MIRRIVFAVVISASSAAAAFAQNAAPSSAPQKMFPTGVTWTLTSLNGKPVAGDPPTIQLDTQMRLRGFGGCNSFSATAYPLKNQGFAVGPVAVTRKECDKPVMDSEKAYLLGVRTSRVWDARNGRLTLRGEAGELVFDRALF
jgi:heat shock protein HslJ